MGDAQKFFASVALALVVLAAFAPHIDRLLSHTTGIKSSVLEIQLANISTKHKLVIPEANKGFPEQTIFPLLANAEDNIEEDINHVKFTIHDLQSLQKQNSTDERENYIKEQKAKLTDMTTIKGLLGDIVAPVANCVSKAVDRGYSRESARLLAREAANMTAQIIELTELLPDESKLDTGARLQRELKRNAALSLARQRLKTELSTLSGMIPGSWDPESVCIKHATVDENKWDVFLDHVRYRALPYYPTIMTGLLAFLDYDALALRFLNKTESDLTFHEYQLPWLHYKIFALRNEPVVAYKYLLDQIQETARERLATVARIEGICRSQTNRCKDELPQWEEWTVKIRKHAQRAEQLALNNLAFGIAQDIAADIDGAKYFAPLALEATDKLEKQVQDCVKSQEIGAFANRTECESARDTIAFVAIAVEAATEQTPDQRKIKKAIGKLEQVVATQTALIDEQRAANKKVDESDRNLRNLARAHLSAARALIDE